MGRATKILIAVILCTAVAGLLGLVFSVGLTDPIPDYNGIHAHRALALDSRLRLGMSRAEVEKTFRDNVQRFREDSVESYGWHCDGCGNYWSNEIDLDVFDVRPHFWDAAGIVWTVRTRFNHQNRLIQHRVQPESCCSRAL